MTPSSATPCAHAKEGAFEEEPARQEHRRTGRRAGAAGVWTFEGPTPLQGTGSGNLSITEQANPNGTVKIQDSGLSSLGKALTFTDKGAAHDVRVRGAIEQQKDFTVSFWVRDAEASAPAAGKRTLLLHSAG